MRQVTSLHRTLVVLAVGLLALAAPLLAYADGGPTGAVVLDAPTRRREARNAGLLLYAGISSSRRSRACDAPTSSPSARRARSPPRSRAPLRRELGRAEHLGRGRVCVARDLVQAVGAVGEPHGLLARAREPRRVASALARSFASTDPRIS